MIARKRDAFFASLRLTSDGYETAERKIRLETIFFVGDVRVKWANDK
jgi:predicted membrane protein